MKIVFNSAFKLKSLPQPKSPPLLGWYLGNSFQNLWVLFAFLFKGLLYFDELIIFFSLGFDTTLGNNVLNGQIILSVEQWNQRKFLKVLPWKFACELALFLPIWNRLTDKWMDKIISRSFAELFCKLCKLLLYIEAINNFLFLL